MSQWQTQDQFEGVALPIRFVARQPILDRSRNTYGYELLFREGWENRFSGDAETSTRTIIDSTLVYGIESLVGVAVPFVNCTYAVIVKDLASMLPCASVIEILEDVVVDDDLVCACAKLRSQGFRIALDDFDFQPKWDPLLGMADFIKVDFLASTSEQRVALVHQLSKQSTLFVAEKIEDEEAFQSAVREGFHLFQGYFFARPVVVARPAIGLLAQRLHLLHMIRDPDLSTQRILQLLKQETSLALRLLRLSNSAAAAARDRISDMQTALAMVGHERFRQLAMATLLTEIASSQTLELQKSILQRSRYCEGMAKLLRLDPNELFFFGVFSMLQPILQLSREEIAQTVPLDPCLMDALFGQQNRCRLVLESFTAFEKGKWLDFGAYATALGFHEGDLVQRCYLAQHWATQVIDTALVTD